MTKITVVGAGTMGHGIAQVAALAGYDTALTDVNADALAAALRQIQQNLDGGVARGKITEDAAAAAVGRIRGGHSPSDRPPESRIVHALFQPSAYHETGGVGETRSH